MEDLFVDIVVFLCVAAVILYLPYYAILMAVVKIRSKKSSPAPVHERLEGVE